MISPTFIDVVIFLHERAVKSYGGLAGVRDENGLRAALARPENKLFYGDWRVDLFDLAAAYAFGIVDAHPFNDGNKRTAWATCALFLERADIAAPVTSDAAGVMVRLAKAELSEAAFAAWLRVKCVPVEP